MKNKLNNKEKEILDRSNEIMDDTEMDLEKKKDKIKGLIKEAKMSGSQEAVKFTRLSLFTLMTNHK